MGQPAPDGTMLHLAAPTRSSWVNEATADLETLLHLILLCDLTNETMVAGVLCFLEVGLLDDDFHHESCAIAAHGRNMAHLIDHTLDTIIEVPL